MVIKEFTRDNLVDALKLGFGFWTETPVFVKYEWDDDEAYNFIINTIEEYSRCGYIAYEDERPIGFMVGFIGDQYFTKTKCLYEEFLYVIPEKRGSMAAYRLVRKWEQFGIDNGIKDMWFNISTGINSEKSMKFIMGLGYEPISAGFRKVV
jgi:GNAT superfamily N-acetyltransferase